MSERKGGRRVVPPPESTPAQPAKKQVKEPAKAGFFMPGDAGAQTPKGEE